MMTGERRAQKNWALFAVLLCLAAVLFVITIIKVGHTGGL